MNCPVCNNPMTDKGKKLWYCENASCDVVQKRKRAFDPLSIHEVKELLKKERCVSRKLRKQLRNNDLEPCI